MTTQTQTQTTFAPVTDTHESADGRRVTRRIVSARTDGSLVVRTLTERTLTDGSVLARASESDVVDPERFRSIRTDTGAVAFAAAQTIDAAEREGRSLGRRAARLNVDPDGRPDADAFRAAMLSRFGSR